MKWPGSSDHNGMLSHTNGHVSTQQIIAQQMPDGNRPQQVPRSQDDLMVGYMFQRSQNDPEFPGHPHIGKQNPRWALGDESIIDSHEKWKWSGKLPHQINNVMPYEMHQLAIKPGGEQHVVFVNSHMPQMAALSVHQPPRNGQIAPSAKKLWGVDEGQKDEPKGMLHLNDHQMWQSSTWSTAADHAVSQPITMVPRRGGGGGFPGSEGGAGGILSPRGSETGAGLGVKMVEYVLGTSPTNKDLEPRMRTLALNDSSDKSDKDKAPSPFDSKKDMENGNGPQQNGISQNGLMDDDKFKRFGNGRVTEEEMHKQNGMHVGGGGQIVVIGVNGAKMAANGEMDSHHLAAAQHHSLLQQHHQLNQHHLGSHHMENLSHHFEHVVPLEQAQFEGYQQGAVSSPGNQLQQQQGFDVQQLFRSQQQQQATPQQIQLLQQQQYLATQQQQQLAGLGGPTAAFPTTPYVLNGQEPYVGLIAGPTVLPQYYNVAPWGVAYPAGLVPSAQQQRRPLTPSEAAGGGGAANTNIQQYAVPTQVQGQYQVIPAYYDQNGSLVMRSIGSGTPMRLVSPAPVLVNGQAQAQPGMRLVGAQPGGQQAQSMYAGQQSIYSSAANGNSIGGGQYSSGQYAAVNNSLGYAGQLGNIGSPALGSLGSGLGLNTSSGRRDSFDRNTSAFSPSIEYGRNKWPQNYGALGTVTASPSPLGLASGSMSPPPSLSAMGSSGSLQLGALMSGASRLSAAPGAEAKFRNGGVGLTANGMFGSSNSLFGKLGGQARVTAAPGLDKPAGRSRMLEDFRDDFVSRNNRYPNLQLRDLANHITEFSQDQHGSRFIQQKLERATVGEKQMVFAEILSAAYNLMTDVFGNYVIQKFFEFGTAEQKTTLAQQVRGHVLPLALQMYGCRVIQKALESISPEHQQEIVRELDGHVLKCVKDQNGNHVVQKCIECVEPHALQFIINAFQGQVFALSTHPYGCRVIQRILEHCTPEQTSPILDELHSHVEQLIQDQYGNYVIQHVLEHGKPENKSQIIMSVRGKVLNLSQHKFASNVVEKCVTHATRAERVVLIEEVCSFNDNALHVMMKDQYANYVVQKMIDVSEPGQRKTLMHKIRPHLNSLRKYTYGKHIIAKLEKFFQKTAAAMGVGPAAPDLGPIGPPSNAL